MKSNLTPQQKEMLDELIEVSIREGHIYAEKVSYASGNVYIALKTKFKNPEDEKMFKSCMSNIIPFH